MAASGTCIYCSTFTDAVIIDDAYVCKDCLFNKVDTGELNPGTYYCDNCQENSGDLHCKSCRECGICEITASYCEEHSTSSCSNCGERNDGYLYCSSCTECEEDHGVYCWECGEDADHVLCGDCYDERIAAATPIPIDAVTTADDGTITVDGVPVAWN